MLKRKENTRDRFNYVQETSIISIYPNFFQCHDQKGTIFLEGESYTQDCVTYKCTKLGKKMMTMVPSVIGTIKVRKIKVQNCTFRKML